ncbi:MAG: class I SAM-dependent methyltransferase [Candidatus Omnitrophota bacterium]
MITENIPCQLCQSGNFRAIYTGHAPGYNYRIVRCLKCGVVFMNPRPDSESNINLYQEGYYHFDPCVDKDHIKQAVFHQNLIAKHISRGTILDIGCDKGFFLELCKQAGMDVHGIDVSKQACDFSRKKSLNVRCARAEQTGFDNSYFDAVTLWQTIEHVRVPAAVLNEINRILKPGGLIFIETPNINSIFYKFYRRFWLGFNHFHMFYFSPKTIIDFLEPAGFTITGINTHTASIFSKDGLWIRGLKTPVLRLVKFLGFEKVIRNIFPKKQPNHKVNSSYQSPESDYPVSKNNLISMLNYLIEHIINAGEMGDNILILAKKKENGQKG